MTLIVLLLAVALVVAVLAVVRARAGADETVREAHDARKAAQQTGIRITHTATTTESVEITGWGPGHGQALERLAGTFGQSGAAADQLQWGSGGTPAGRHAVEPPRRAQLPPVYQSTADLETDLDGELVERPRRRPRADDGPYTDWAGR